MRGLSVRGGARAVAEEQECSARAARLNFDYELFPLHY